jgi:hypothetical protein
VEEDSTEQHRDRFGQLLDAIGPDAPDDALTNLAQRYSYVFPDHRSLAELGTFGPLVEIGAGTGYWAFRLRALGVDIVAFDEAPPDGARPNRFHATTPTWTAVSTGDHTVLTQYSERALFLCWAPLFSSLGECLAFYSGNTVAVIGDGGHRTTRLSGLNERFTRTVVYPVHALEPMPGVAATLSVWHRAPH